MDIRRNYARQPPPYLVEFRLEYNLINYIGKAVSAEEYDGSLLCGGASLGGFRFLEESLSESKFLADLLGARHLAAQPAVLSDFCHARPF